MSFEVDATGCLKEKPDVVGAGECTAGVAGAEIGGVLKADFLIIGDAAVVRLAGSTSFGICFVVAESST